MREFFSTAMRELHDGIVSGTFMLASWKSRHSLIEQLAAIQAQRYRLNGQGQYGNILHLAVQYERVEILRVLLHIPAVSENLLLTATYGKAPIHLAIELANPRTLICLLRYTSQSYRQAQWALTRHGQVNADVFSAAIHLFRWQHLKVLLEVGIEQELPIQAMLENQDFWRALCQQFRRRYKQKVVRDIFSAMLKDTRNVIDWLNQNYATLQGYETLMTQLKISATIAELRHWIDRGLGGDTTPVVPVLAQEYIADWQDLKKPLSALLVECSRRHDNFSAEKAITIIFSYFQDRYQEMSPAAVFTELMTFYFEHLTSGFLHSNHYNQDLDRVFFLKGMSCRSLPDQYIRLGQALSGHPATGQSIAESLAESLAHCFKNQLAAMGTDVTEINRFAQCLYACVVAGWFTEQLGPHESPEHTIIWFFQALKSHAIFSPRMSWLTALANTRFVFGYPLVKQSISLGELVANNGFICHDFGPPLYFDQGNSPAYYPELGLCFSYFDVSRVVLGGVGIDIEAVTQEVINRRRALSLAVRPPLAHPLSFIMDQALLPRQKLSQAIDSPSIVKGKRAMLPSSIQDENKLSFIRRLIIEDDEDYDLRKEALKLWIKPSAYDGESIFDEITVRESEIFMLEQARRAMMLAHEQLIFYRALKINHRLENSASKAVTLYLTKLSLADQLNNFQRTETNFSRENQQAYLWLRDNVFSAVSDEELRLALHGWLQNGSSEFQRSFAPVVNSLISYVDGVFVQGNDPSWSVLLWEKLIDTLNNIPALDQNIPVLKEIKQAWQSKLGELQQAEAYKQWSKSAEQLLNKLKSKLMGDFANRLVRVDNHLVDYQHVYQAYSYCEDLLPVALLVDNPLFKHTWLQYGRISLQRYSQNDEVFECMRVAVERRQPDFCRLLEAAGLDPFILPAPTQRRIAHANESAPLVMILSYKDQDNTPEGKLRLRLKKEYEKKEKMLQWICDCVAARLQPEFIWQRYGAQGPLASPYYQAVYHCFTQLNWVLVNYIRINYGINLTKTAEISRKDVAWQYLSSTLDSIRSSLVSVDESRMVDLANYFHFSQEQFMRAIPEPEEFSIRIANFLDSSEIKRLPGKLHAYVREVVKVLDNYLTTHRDNLTNEQRYNQLSDKIEKNRESITPYEEFLEKRNRESRSLARPDSSDERRLREAAERRAEEEHRLREEERRLREEERRLREEERRLREEERRLREEQQKENEKLRERLRFFESMQQFNIPNTRVENDGPSSSFG